MFGFHIHSWLFHNTELLEKGGSHSNTKPAALCDFVDHTIIPTAVSLWALLLLIETLKHTIHYQEGGDFSSSSIAVSGHFLAIKVWWCMGCLLVSSFSLCVYVHLFMVLYHRSWHFKEPSLSITSFCIASHTEEIFIFSSIFKFCFKIHLCGSWVKLFRIKLLRCSSWCPSYCPNQDSIERRTGKLIQNGHGPSKIPQEKQRPRCNCFHLGYQNCACGRVFLHGRVLPMCSYNQVQEGPMLGLDA